MEWKLLLYWTPREMDKVILEKKQLPSAVGSEMSILIKTFIFKYISWFICSDMYLLHANIQTPGLRKLEKGILMKDMNSKIKAEKCKEKKIFLFPNMCTHSKHSRVYRKVRHHLVQCVVAYFLFLSLIYIERMRNRTEVGFRL